jgi:aminopeptidase N
MKRIYLPLQFFLAITILLSCSFAIFGVRRERLMDAWRPVHYDISITLNDKLSQIISARAEIDIVALKKMSVVDLDFGDLTTDSVSLNSKDVSFIHRNGKLDVSLPENAPPGTRLTLSITYHGKPSDGLIFKTDKDGKPSVVGDNWPDRVHHWIPSFDHPSAKATVTFHITAPGNNLVIANGRLQNVTTVPSNTKIWTYTESVPIPAYCMIIGVGDFAKIDAPRRTSIPLIYFVSHSDSSFAVKGFAPALPALEMFSQIVAPYPYEKLALIVGATQFGGMENSSAIVFTQTLFNIKPDAKLSATFGIPDSVERAVAHEIAHQWFGDSVTESTWADLWLSEGFATYFAGLFIQKYDGQQAFDSYMKDAGVQVFTFEKKTLIPIHDRETEKLFDLLNENNYQKGAWVLHMLRSRLGDDVFFRAVRIYYQKHKDGTANTEDLREVFEAVSGKPLRSFFARWVYGSGHPQYQLTWQWLPRQKSIKISLNQVQSSEAFLDPLPVLITSNSGANTIKLTPSSKTYVQFVRSAQKPSKVDVDPNHTLLKEVTVRTN